MTAKERDPKDTGDDLYLVILRHETAGPVETLFLRDGGIVPARRRLIVLLNLDPEKAADLELLAYGKSYGRALAAVPPPMFADRLVPRLLIHRGTDDMPVDTCIIPSASRDPTVDSVVHPTVKRFVALIDVGDMTNEPVIFLALGDKAHARAMDKLGPLLGQA